jgi:hypothetical protein
VDCRDNIEFQMGVPLWQYLNALPYPIVLVDGNVRAEWANTATRQLLGKSESDIIGNLGGEVFECAYSRLPGGCGHTVHCSGCVIRHSVTHTYTTGESCSRVPAVLHCGENNDLRLYISTYKSGERVLLQIEEQVTAT